MWSDKVRLSSSYCLIRLFEIFLISFKAKRPEIQITSSKSMDLTLRSFFQNLELLLSTLVRGLRLVALDH